MKKKRLHYLSIVILIVITIFICFSIWSSTNCPIVNNYEFTTNKTSSPLRIVVLSDLHNHEFGENNSELVEKVLEQSPDLILLAGDFLNEDSDNADIPCELIKELSESTPVYLALGNHEIAYIENQDTNLIQELEAAGAEALEDEYIDLELNGTSLRLGGMFGYAFGYNAVTGYNESEYIDEERGAFLKEFQNTERLKIMMSHRPDSFVFGDASSYWDVDLVVSGHDHGGQVVVPFLGGLYGGDQGWFPEYIHGMYQKDDMNIFITSGLGSQRQKLPRFNNRPEIAVLTIKAGE